jgi:hypothetical protein
MGFRIFQKNLKEMQLNIDLTFFKWYNHFSAFFKQLKYSQPSIENLEKTLENEQIPTLAAKFKK